MTSVLPIVYSGLKSAAESHWHPTIKSYAWKLLEQYRQVAAQELLREMEAITDEMPVQTENFDPLLPEVPIVSTSALHTARENKGVHLDVDSVLPDVQALSSANKSRDTTHLTIQTDPMTDIPDIPDAPNIPNVSNVLNIPDVPDVPIAVLSPSHHTSSTNS